MNPSDTALLLVTIAATAQLPFVLIYGLRSPWRSSQTGRAIFTKALALALLLADDLSTRWLGSYPGHDYVHAAVLALVALGCWLQLVALIHEKLRRPTRGGFDEERTGGDR